MKMFASLLTVLAFVGSAAFAADAEKAVKDTVDHSTTLTGAKKTVVKHKSKMKNEDGSAGEKTVTETTKVHKNGKVEKSSKTDTSAESADPK